MSHSRVQPHASAISVSLDRLRQQLAAPFPFCAHTMSGSESSYRTSAEQHDDDDLDSLPSSLSSGVLSSDSADSADAQREWEESLEQIQLLLTMVLVPFAGKYLGRKFAYWSRSSFSPEEGEGRCMQRRMLTDWLYRLGKIHGVGT